MILTAVVMIAIAKRAYGAVVAMITMKTVPVLTMLMKCVRIVSVAMNERYLVFATTTCALIAIRMMTNDQRRKKYEKIYKRE